MIGGVWLDGCVITRWGCLYVRWSAGLKNPNWILGARQPRNRWLKLQWFAEHTGPVPDKIDAVRASRGCVPLVLRQTAPGSVRVLWTALRPRGERWRVRGRTHTLRGANKENLGRDPRIRHTLTCDKGMFDAYGTLYTVHGRVTDKRMAGLWTDQRGFVWHGLQHVNIYSSHWFETINLKNIRFRFSPDFILPNPHSTIIS